MLELLKQINWLRLQCRGGEATIIIPNSWFAKHLVHSRWVKKFDAGQRNPYPEQEVKASPCLGHILPVNSADMKALGHQVLLCCPRRFGRGAEPSEQPQSCSPACPALTARLCHSQGTGARAHSHGQQNKDSCFGLRLGEMQTAPLPAKTPPGKVSSLWCEFPLV